mgnify:FL=1
MSIIQDGKGTGKVAEVDANNMLAVKAVTITEEHYATHTQGKGWHIVVQQTPTGANDNFLYFKNISEDETYIIEGFDSRVASAETIEVYLNPNGTTSGGTDVTPTISNTSHQATSMSATIEAGNDITGLSNGNLFHRIYLTNTDTKHTNFNLDLALEPGGSFVVRAVNGSIQTDLTFQVYSG